MSALLPLEDAWARLFAFVGPAKAETVAVDEAAGRYLAAPLTAHRTQPAHDLSAMDGFAVAGGGPWRIVGETRAGVPFGRALAPGEAARISTGAVCPDGTEAIVILEDGAVAGELLRATAAPSSEHIRRRGFDFAAGAPLLERGAPIGPAQIALARAAGHADLAVGRQPRLAIIECGDELVANPREAGDHRLPASNGAMVAAMCRPLARAIDRIGPLPDDRAALAAAFAQARNADVIVTTAGASVGAHDHVRGALQDWGATLDFWRVAIRPGKPLLVAQRGEQLVLGLPGNPTSAFVTAFLFLLPLLRAMAGAARPLPPALPLRLAQPLPAGGARREFRRARLSEEGAVPIDERDSSALLALGHAVLLIDRPIDAPAARAGDEVTAYWIGIGGMA